MSTETLQRLNWTMFDRSLYGRSRMDKPMVSIRKGAATMALNAAALDLLGNPTHVILAFDRQALAIGIKPATENDPVALKISKGVVASTRFFQWAQVDPEPPRRYFASGEDEWLVIYI